MAGAVARPVVLLAILVAAMLAACGGEDAGGRDEAAAGADAVPWLDPDGEFPVVGSLAVNPADDALWMSTNTGLFRIAGERKRPAKVSGTLTTPDGAGTVSEQLVVHFTGPDQLLASGHPAASETGLPEALGLIRSGDAGKSWTPVSELGTADFHAIERSGGLLVGALFGQAQILVSRDGGRTWEGRVAPKVLIDLAVDPSDPARWVATASDGVYMSRDEGATWRPVDTTPNSYLAWPEADALYRLDPGGPLQVSRNGGAAWEEIGSTGGEPQALAAADADTLYAALIDGTVKRSEDGGRNWDDHVAPGG
jgi:photosystem II stability/assembly factor-like uncharacterized protein